VCFAMSALPVIGVLILGLTTKPQKAIGRE
jgi:hypothetical protein